MSKNKRPRFAAIYASCLMMLTVTACSGGYTDASFEVVDGPDFSIVVNKAPSDVKELALLSGELEMRQNCLGIYEEGNFTPVVFPAGTSLRDGDIIISSGVEFTLNDQAEMGGGFHKLSEPDDTRMSCLSGTEFFIAHSIQLSE